jgi:hypothetical protein
MLATDTLPSIGKSAETTAKQEAGRYFFGPVRDFLLLGGASLVLLPIVLVLPGGAFSTIAWVMLLVAIVINNPHFAHSYQLFYERFGTKSGPASPRSLRIRYLLAGVIVPAALAVFLAITIATGDLHTLGIAGNTMAFFVGWHYVKQGYGMLIVDGVLKRRFFKESEKRALVINAYAVWSVTWISVNTGGYDSSRFGIDYFLLALPQIFLVVAMALALVTSVWAAYVMLKRLLAGEGVPLNGAVAYLVTLYLWMLFVRIDPIWLLVVPALHSLQYLVVVWRFQLNRQTPFLNGRALTDSIPPRPVRMKWFVAQGIVLGLLGFYIIPFFLEVIVHPAASDVGASVFFFAFWIFVNVHHYFIDNVMWRSENADVKRFLFSPPPSKVGSPSPERAAA